MASVGTKATRDTAVGTEFVGRLKTPTQERSNDFSGGFPKGPSWPNTTIHTSLSFAEECGFASCVVAGAMNEGYLAELMIDVFGIDWMRGETMSVKFVAVVKPGETVLPKATVRARVDEADRVRFALDVWCENQSGQKVIVGTATGSI